MLEKNLRTNKKKPRLIERITAVFVPTDHGQNWELAAKALVAVGLFLTPLFVGSWTNDPWELQKLMLLLAVVIGGWLCLMMAMIKRQSDRWSWHPLDWLVLLYGLVVTVSAALSMNWWTSLFGFSGWASHSLLATWVLIGLYFLVAKIFHGASDRRLVWTLLLSGIGISLVVQLFQFANLSLLLEPFSSSRWFSTLANYNLHVTIIAATFALAMLLLWTKVEENWAKWLLAAGAVISWLILFFSGRALGWGIFALAMVVVVLQQARAGKKVEMKAIVVAIGLAALGLVAQMTSVANSSGLPRLNEMSLDQKTTYAITGETLKQRPVLGAGPAAWYQAFVKYRPTSFNQQAVWDLRFAQGGSAWPQLMTTVGVVGVLLFLGLLGLGGWMCLMSWRKSDDASLLISAFILVAVLITGWFTTWSWVLLVMAWASLGLSRTTVIDWSREKTRALPAWSYIVMTIATLATVGITVPFIGVYASDAMTSRANTLLSRSTPVEKVINLLKTALALDKHNEAAAKFLTDLYAQRVVYEADAKQYEAASKDVTLALNNIRKSISLNPENPALYEAENQILNGLAPAIPDAVTRGKNNFIKLRQIESTNPIHDVAYGQVVMLEVTSRTGDNKATDQELKNATNTAIAAFNQALNKKPMYFQARLAKAQALTDGKRYADALGSFPDLASFIPAQRNLIWRVFALADIGLDKNDDAVKAYQQAIAEYSTDPSAYLSLADLYVKMGKKDLAKKVLEEAQVAMPKDTQFKAKITELGL